MGCCPAVKLRVLKVAVAAPLPGLSVPWPMLAAPSKKLTVPPGILEPPGGLGATVAVKVTSCPGADGLAEELSAVLVPAGCTPAAVTLKLLEVEPARPVALAVSV